MKANVLIIFVILVVNMVGGTVTATLTCLFGFPSEL